MLKYGIIGVGGLGKVHLRNTAQLEREGVEIRLTALCDVEESRFYEKVKLNVAEDSEPVDLSAYRLYNDAREMLDREELDFVITALPTDIHSEIALMALDKGCHVFSEKPMARTLEQCRAMAERAGERNKLLMIGQCLRYWPEYRLLKAYIEDARWGQVLRAEFKRYSSTPLWSWKNWLMDEAKSGGAALDMHVHDVDFIQWAFGKPKAVSSTALHVKSGYDAIFTTYSYDGKLVSSACDWSMAQGFPFDASYLVRFEKGTLEMTRNGLKAYPEGGEPFTPELAGENAYLAEMRDFIRCIQNESSLSVVTPDSAALSVELALAEMESAGKGSPVLL